MGVFYDGMTNTACGQEILSLREKVKELEAKLDVVVNYISDLELDLDEEFEELETVLNIHENSIEELQDAAVLLLEDELEPYIPESERKVWNVDVGNRTTEEVKAEVDRIMDEKLPPDRTGKDWLTMLEEYWGATRGGVEPSGL